MYENKEFEINFTDILSKIKYWKLYRRWRNRKTDKPYVDNTQGAGHYLFIGFGASTLIGSVEEQKMESGKIMLKKLLSYETFRNPKNMTRSSKWQYIGYKDETPFSEMEWPEYLKLFTG